MTRLKQELVSTVACAVVFAIALGTYEISTHWIGMTQGVSALISALVFARAYGAAQGMFDDSRS